MQFQDYLSQPHYQEIVRDDQGDLVAIIVEVGTLQGDVNRLLQHHTELEIRAGWFHAKYAGFLAEISRDSTTNFNLIYTQRREKGYGEWDAKRMAETNSEYLKQLIHRDRLQVLVNLLKTLVDVCKGRLAALQQISNNFRAELREDKVTL